MGGANTDCTTFTVLPPGVSRQLLVARAYGPRTLHRGNVAPLGRRILVFLVVLSFGISPILYFRPKLTAVEEQADDEIVHLDGLREADRLAHQALEPRT